jgi:glycosyltransferase involved in cell wall biosynthesis
MGKLDLILSVSRYTRDRIRAQRPELGDERYTIFPNALSETWSNRFGGSGPAPVAAPLPRRFLLSVTRLARGDRYKGLTTVIETLAMLDDTSLHYVIAGRGEDQSFLEGIAHRFRLEGRVHFVGAVSDEELAQLYTQCAAFVLPSGKEGFGIVFLEAMFFGAPVIAAREKGTVDVVQQEHTGLLVPYGDTIALAAAITRILRDNSLRARLRKNGRESVNVDGAFSFDAYVERLGKLYG